MAGSDIDSAAAPAENGRSAEYSSVYKMCYVTGIRLLRLKNRAKRLIRKAAVSFREHLANQPAVAARKWNLLKEHYRHEIEEPFADGFQKTLDLEEGFRQARRAGQGRSYVQGFAKKSSAAAINYLVPAAGAAVLALTIGYYSNMTFALAVEYGGQPIGFVKSETDFDKAEARMKERIVYEEYKFPDDVIPKFSLTVVDAEDITEEDELTNQIIRASGNELVEAEGLYIASRFIGATTEQGAIEEMLDSIKNKYVTGDPDETVEFVDEPEIKSGLYPVTSVMDVGSLENEVNRDETKQKTYTVQKGDAPSLIAQKYDMAYSDLKRLNPDIEKKLLIGQEVLIQKSVPLLGVQVTKTETYNEDIPFKINQVQDSEKVQGYTKVAQMGQKGVKRITAEVTYIDGIETERDILSSEVIKEPVDEKIIVGGKRPLEQLPESAMTTSSNFIWPVGGGYVSCGFYGYWNHGGMDIASKRGTPIYAAASGTVITAKSYVAGPYGKYILIDHGGGVQTLYAHNSAVHVQPGQWVNQGQLIASMGSTGNASGPHCHFEIRINGVRKDPALYIGTTNPY